MRNVSPSRKVGARKFPLGPMTALRISSFASFSRSHSWILRPFAVIIFWAVLSICQAASESIRSFLASTIVLIVIFFPSRTSRLFLHEFQPFRKYAQSIVMVSHTLCYFMLDFVINNGPFQAHFVHKFCDFDMFRMLLISLKNLTAFKLRI